MASITSVDFTAEFQLDNTTKQIILTDTTDYVGQGIIGGDGPAGIITATGPSGVFYNNTNFGDADVPLPLTSPTSTKTIALPIDGNGNILQGSYSVKYTVKLVTGDSSQAEKTVNVSINYSQPIANVIMSVDLGAPLLTSDDQTDYTVDTITPSIVRDHDIFYPASFSVDPIQGVSKVVTTGIIFVIADQVVAYTSTLVSTVVWDYGSGITVSDEVTGNGQLDILGDADICQMYCCVRAAFNRYLKESLTNSRRAQQTLSQLEEVTSILFLMDVAIRCGKTEDINDYTKQIKEILNCNDDCDCGDEPQLVVGAGTGSALITVVSGPGITVTSVTGGGSTEYTISIQADLLTKLNTLFNTTLIEGTNITITSVVDGAGNIVYTINCADQLQSAPDVPITPIIGVPGTDVQAALEGLKGLIDGNTSDIAALTASAIAVVAIAGVTGTEVQTVLESLKDLIDANAAVIAALTATDIATSPIAGVTGTEVQTMLESLKTLIDATVANTTTNTTNIGINASDIATNASDIGTNTSDIAVLQPESWTVVNTFVNEWGSGTISPSLPLQYRKDPWGMLHLVGAVANSGTPSSEDIFVLPVGYRPTGDVIFTAYDNTGGAASLFGIEITSSTGQVTLQGTLQANMRLFVNGSTSLT